MIEKQRYDISDYFHWLETIEEQGRGLSVWEEEFVASVASQLDQGRSLSDKQVQILERIYAEKTP